MAMNTPTYCGSTRKGIESAQTLEEITAIMNLEQEFYQQFEGAIADANVTLQALAPTAAVDDAVHPRAPSKQKSKTTVCKGKSHLDI